MHLTLTGFGELCSASIAKTTVLFWDHIFQSFSAIRKSDERKKILQTKARSFELDEFLKSTWLCSNYTEGDGTFWCEISNQQGTGQLDRDGGNKQTSHIKKLSVVMIVPIEDD